MPRIALVTGKRAAPRLRDLASMLSEKTGWVFEVIEAPVEVAALIPRELLRRVLMEHKGRYDLVIVPGTLGYSVDELEDAAGAPVVKGPEEPGTLLLLVELGEQGLEELKRLKRLEPSLMLDKWLEELRRYHEESPGVEVCGVKVPLRPPPLVVVAEVYVEQGEDHVEEAAEKAGELLRRGADIVVAGFSSSWSTDEALKALSRVVEAVGRPVAIDTPDRVLAAEAVSEGLACLVFTLGMDDPLFDVLPRGTAVVVAPYGKGYSLPAEPSERAEKLKHLVEKAQERGLVPVADPVLTAPGYGFGESIAAYYMASRIIKDTPILAGIANVYELVDADSPGQVAVLTQLVAELGASILLVTEESRKTTMAVTEAAIAATMTGISLLKKRPPKDLGIDLLLAKEKRPQPPPRLPRRRDKVFDASILAAWHGFRQDLTGSHLITVEKDEIRDIYIGRKGVVEIRGTRGEEIYKAAAFLGLASEPSHYAYLGYELCKAEAALMLRRSYVQEKPLLAPPWTRCKYYSAGSKRVVSLQKEN
ncbi:dihydropteroate synthase-like protein [Pyrofollis japonicus]|uniref:dihydropteroate synthase-like protein n=1 Tax=Pyrofollis japonicus TaxID=3060460 RepID=UPI00295AACA4|nr:dihydropteroate synthase-like protein [Pyrofollis japonicus]BEP17745.1 dihydropteroate synthase-like protein [Pyrofollis japonicus]